MPNVCEKLPPDTANPAVTVLETCRDAVVDRRLGASPGFDRPESANEHRTRHYRLHFDGVNRSDLLGGWLVEPELADGSSVDNHPLHVLDLVNWITSDCMVEVYAENNTLFKDNPVEDVNFLSVELADGSPFLIDGFWSTQI